MKTKAMWTSGDRTNVAKRKRNAFIKNLARAMSASLTGQILYSGYLTRGQMRILWREAIKRDMTPGEYCNQIITDGLERLKSKEVAA